MSIKYYKLFDLLNRRGMKKTDLLEIVSAPTLAKLSKGKTVTTEVIGNICKFLDCQPEDIMEYEKEIETMNINNYEKHLWLQNRIVELTELREKELEDWYEDKWTMDDSFEEKLSLKYEDYVREEIDRMEGDELDNSYIETLYQIIYKYRFSHLQSLKDEIKESYKELFPDIWKFFEPFIENFNEEYEKEHTSFVDVSVKNALEEEKADIEKQAIEEYLSE